eukprot:2791807-Pleurochrysis_carterae.AAC.1
MTLAEVEGRVETVGCGAATHALSSSRRAGTVERVEAECTHASATSSTAAAVRTPEVTARRSEVNAVHSASSSLNSAV